MNGARPVPVKTSLDTCDFCRAEFPRSESVYVCTARPSDPSEVVCVLVSCGGPSCQQGTEGTLSGTREQLNRYIESPKAAAAGHRWLCI